MSEKPCSYLLLACSNNDNITVKTIPVAYVVGVVVVVADMLVVAVTVVVLAHLNSGR